MNFKMVDHSTQNQQSEWINTQYHKTNGGVTNIPNSVPKLFMELVWVLPIIACRDWSKHQ